MMNCHDHPSLSRLIAFAFAILLIFAAPHVRAGQPLPEGMKGWWYYTGLNNEGGVRCRSSNRMQNERYESNGNALARDAAGQQRSGDALQIL
jgi:hypothetical protein